MQLPRYMLRPSVTRMLVPQALLLLGVSAFFYTLLLLDLHFFLEEFKIEYAYLSLALILVLFFMEVIVYYLKDSHVRYNFYDDRIEAITKKNQMILYNAVVDISYKRNFFDKMFKTGTIVLKPNFEIRFINNTNNIYFYIQKLVERSRKLNAVVK